jgi:FtsZ-binding cell division protein ZapB
LQRIEEQSVEVNHLRGWKVHYERELQIAQHKLDEYKEANDDLVRKHNDLFQQRDELRKGANRLKSFQADMERTKDDLQRSKKELNDARDDLIDKHRQVRQLKESLHGKNQAIESQHNDLKKANKKEADLLEDVRRLKSELQTMEIELQDSRSGCKRAEERNREQATCIRDLEKKVDELKSFGESQAQDIMRIQERAFQHEKGQWMPDTNREVSDQLTGLSKQLQKWCKTFSKRSILHMDDFSTDDQDRFNAILSDVAPKVSGRYLFQLNDPSVGTRLPELLLTSSLSHNLYARIFSNPFFFDDYKASSTQSGGSSKSALAKLWENIQKGKSIPTTANHFTLSNYDPGDENGANHWRSETLRLLDPCATDLRAMRNSKKGGHALREAIAEGFAADFLAGNASVLLDPDNRRSSEERCKVLTEIVLKATEISYRLWTRRSRLKCLQLKELEAESALKFGSCSPILEHHELHNLLINEDKRALDGRNVAIVAHPAVVAYGDPEGNDYLKRTTWKKAVVWMG